MLYFRLTPEDQVTAIAFESKQPQTEQQWYFDINGKPTGKGGWLNRNDMPTMEFARRVADAATENAKRGANGTIPYQLYIPIDNGPGCYPRYDVVAAPMVNDVVSKGFNGDYYPVGRVVKVSTNLRVITTCGDGEELKFYRRGESARWVQAGGTWTLVHGERNERNPSF